MPRLGIYVDERTLSYRRLSIAIVAGPQRWMLDNGLPEHLLIGHARALVQGADTVARAVPWPRVLTAHLARERVFPQACSAVESPLSFVFSPLALIVSVR